MTNDRFKHASEGCVGFLQKVGIFKEESTCKDLVGLGIYLHVLRVCKDVYSEDVDYELAKCYGVLRRATTSATKVYHNK